MKLASNDTSKYEESAGDVLREYKEIAKMSDLVSSKKFKFKKFIPRHAPHRNLPASLQRKWKTNKYV